MTLRPQSLPPVSEATVAAVQAASPKGNLYVALCAQFGALYDDQLFADRYPPAGRPMEVAPWRLALVVVMPYIVPGDGPDPASGRCGGARLRLL